MSLDLSRRGVRYPGRSRGGRRRSQRLWGAQVRLYEIQLGISWPKELVAKGLGGFRQERAQAGKSRRPLFTNRAWLYATRLSNGR